MKFFGQAMAHDADQRGFAEQLCAWLKDSDFEHPHHLRAELERYAAQVRQAWHVTMHQGVVNVAGARGILVRIHPST